MFMTLFLYFWSIIIELFYLSLTTLKPISKKINENIGPRVLSEKDLIVLKKKRQQYKKCIIFFCSSAGEYEQALPIIKRLEKKDSFFIYVISFSKSGYDFIISQGGKTAHTLSPPDSIYRWNIMFRYLMPSCVILVRHELWPSFLYCANKTCPTYLINASLSTSSQFSFFKILAKKMLYPYFRQIFVLSPSERNNISKYLNISMDKLITSGDTKYDRVYERSLTNIGQVMELSTYLNKYCTPNQRLIVGSSWEKDTTLALDTLLLFQKKNMSSNKQIIIAPHKVNLLTIEWTTKQCQKRGLSYCLFTDIIQGNQPKKKHIDIIIVNYLGKLAELYACSNFSFVGGGLHYQVHNTLEPACYGSKIAFGPFYKNSPEAIKLVQEQLASVITQPEELLKWWNTKPNEVEDHKEKIKLYLKKDYGSSKIILNHILK